MSFFIALFIVFVSNLSPFPQPLSGEGGEGVEWDQVCLLALGRSLCVWDTFLRPLLFDRVKVCEV